MGPFVSGVAGRCGGNDKLVSGVAGRTQGPRDRGLDRTSGQGHGEGFGVPDRGLWGGGSTELYLGGGNGPRTKLLRSDPSLTVVGAAHVDRADVHNVHIASINVTWANCIAILLFPTTWYF